MTWLQAVVFISFLIIRSSIAYVGVHIERVPHINLDDGVEHAIRLTKGAHSIFYFHMPSTRMPLYMTVTPCATPVRWNLYIPNQYASHPLNVHPNSALFNNLLHVRIPPLIEVTRESNDEMILLGGETDENRMQYFNSAVDAEYVMLNLSAVENTTVRVFITTAQTRMEKQYPPLPRDKHLNHTIYNDHDHFTLYTIAFNWQLPSAIQKMNNMNYDLHRYKFCILLTKTPLYTLCPGKNVISEAEHCVNQTQTQMMISNQKSKGQLFATLLIRDNISQRSSALFPVEIKLPIDLIEKEILTRKRLIRNEDMTTIVTLRDAVADEWVMAPVKHNVRNYEFVVPKSRFSGQAHFSIRVCAGNVDIRVFKDHKQIKLFSHVSDTIKRFIINNVNDETLLIQVINNRNRESGFDIWGSMQSGKNLYPVLPEDANLHAQSLTCTSVSLQFYPVQSPHIAYCLYLRDLDNHPVVLPYRKLSAKDVCWPTASRGELVNCFEEDKVDKKDVDKETLLHMQLPFLQPNRTYEFTVTALDSRVFVGGRDVVYKTQRIHTKSC